MPFAAGVGTSGQAIVICVLRKIEEWCRSKRMCSVSEHSVSFYIAILPGSAYKCLVNESTVNVCAHGKCTILALEDDRAVGIDEGATPMKPIG